MDITAVYIAIRCPLCGRVLAETDGARLYLSDSASTTKDTRLDCRGRLIADRHVRCDGRKVWRAAVCYTVAQEVTV